MVWSSITGGDGGYSCSYGMCIPTEKFQELICLLPFRICNEHIITQINTNIVNKTENQILNVVSHANNSTYMEWSVYMELNKLAYRHANSISFGLTT